MMKSTLIKDLYGEIERLKGGKKLMSVNWVTGFIWLHFAEYAIYF